ncbi:MAG: hypothetical protein HYT30_01715 [Parcubacteria group bacterium]|nr:hypothetical protein [Parcubacteria group bacterium]
MADPKIGASGSKGLDRLRGKPKDDKTVIAGGVAVFVVAILLVGWGIMFLKKISQENTLKNIKADSEYTSLRDTVGRQYDVANFGDTPSRDSLDNPFGESI